MTDGPLGGLKVLVTRPEDQAERLCQLIKQKGGQVERLPVLRILPLTDRAGTFLAQAGGYDVMIFVSANAVHHALPGLPAPPWHTPPILAVGQATAEAIRSIGLPVAWTPQERFDSEALLASPILMAVAGKRVLIVRGEGGRALLGHTLMARGARVDEAEVYRRSLAAPIESALLQQWHERVEVITATSNDILDGLLTLCGEAGRSRLLETPLVVISPRMAEHARRRGFQVIDQASQAGDAAILECLCTRWGIHTHSSC
ncbi:Uroporphyrinogen-III synthase [Gammaproteobacteria bacterium]